MLTLFYAGALTLIALFLAFKTGQKRLASETMLGTGDSFELLQATRAHGNLVENAVFFLLLTGLLEVSGAVSNLTIGILGDLFILARISHAYGILQPESVSIFRTIGAGTSMLVLFLDLGCSLTIGASKFLRLSILWLSEIVLLRPQVRRHRQHRKKESDCLVWLKDPRQVY